MIIQDTVVQFGGTIKLGALKSKNNSNVVGVVMQDTAPSVIGSDLTGDAARYNPNLSKVILEFNNVDSIDAFMTIMKEAKEMLIDNNSNKK